MSEAAASLGLGILMLTCSNVSAQVTRSSHDIMLTSKT